jgi:tripartite-type tricarboxylate transporter receptor subunit TctC
MLLVASSASAIDYPLHPVKIVVPVPPGGTLDVQARSIGAQLGETLKQPFIVESRPGGGGTIGATYVARSAPDGYTLLLSLRTLAISPSVIANLAFDPVKDFEPVTLVESTYWVFCATPSLPVKTLQDVIALAKSRPGGLNYAGTGIGGDNHLTMEQFKMVTGAPMTQIPYAGGAPALVALLGGQVDVMLVPGALAIPNIKSGKLKPIAIVGHARAPVIPDVPTFTQSGVPGFEGGSWTGLFAPKGTPKSVVELLNTEIKKILDHNRDTNTMYTEGIQEPRGSTPEELGVLVREDVAKWRAVAESVGIKPE